MCYDVFILRYIKNISHRLYLLAYVEISIEILVYTTVIIFFYLDPSQADYPFILSSQR